VRPAARARLRLGMFQMDRMFKTFWNANFLEKVFSFILYILSIPVSICFG